MKEKEGAKDKHVYRHTFSRSGGEGDTFDEEQNKEQDRSSFKHIANTREGRDVKDTHSYRQPHTDTDTLWEPGDHSKRQSFHTHNKCKKHINTHTQTNKI